MFTTDFSKAPRPAQGTSLFFGGTRYGGIRSLVQLLFVWRRVAKTMTSSPGYMGHYIWYRFPFTFGNFSLWDTREHMMEFARGTEHRAAISWLVKPGTARGAFIRFFQVEPAGHSIGRWRAEYDPAEEWRIPRMPFSDRTSSSASRSQDQ